MVGEGKSFYPVFPGVKSAGKFFTKVTKKGTLSLQVLAQIVLRSRRPEGYLKRPEKEGMAEISQLVARDSRLLLSLTTSGLVTTVKSLKYE